LTLLQPEDTGFPSPKQKEESVKEKLPTEPKGELVIRTLAMPGDTNPNGDMFGGWLLCQMDIGGGIAAKQLVRGRVITVAISSMRFWNPVHVGDTVCVHAELSKIGSTSVSFNITAWAVAFDAREDRRLVTDAIFTYVCIDEEGKPSPIEEEYRQEALRTLEQSREGPAET
jgi:acyl-CoA thioesterase YciA